jgi:Domain of unknown function (DUF4189)
MKKMEALLLFGLVLLLVGVAHAEGNCPPGKYHATPPDAPQIFCAPIPVDKNGQPLPIPQRATHWGAIATELTSPSRIGAAQDLPTKGQAEQAALAQCAAKGGQNCKVKISYGNGCAALIANDTGYQANADVTMGYAVQTGMQMCSTAGHGTCHVVYSACSQQ